MVAMTPAEALAAVMQRKLRASGHDLIELRSANEVRRFFSREGK